MVILPQRQTALVAKQAAEVDVLSGGRLGLGWASAGTGSSTRRWALLQEPRPPVRGADRAAAEALEQASSRSRAATTRSKRAGINPLPIQRPIRIWIGGGATPAVLERIGRLADGWIANAGLSADLDERIAAIHASAERAGRDPSEIGIQGASALLKRDDGDDVDNLRRQVDAARERNLSHLVVLTMGQGRSPEEHIDAVRTAGEALR